MSIRILYFASVRDAMGRSDEHIEALAGAMTVAELRSYLVARPDGMPLAECRNLRCAVNQAMASDDTVIDDGAEVAFFPPVTGG